MPDSGDVYSVGERWEAREEAGCFAFKCSKVTYRKRGKRVTSMAIGTLK